MTQPPYDTALSDEPDSELVADCIDDHGGAITWDAAIDLFDLTQQTAANDDPLPEEDLLGSVVVPHGRAHDRLLLDQLSSLRHGLRRKHHSLYTHVATFSGIPHSDGAHTPPADYLHSLVEEPWEAIRDSIYSAFEGTEYEYARLLEPSPLGYPRCHTIVFSNEDRSERWFDRAHSVFVENSSVARDGYLSEERHFAAERSMLVDEVVSDRLRGFLDRRGGKASRAFSALLWATDQPRFSYSNGAGSYMDDVSVPLESPMGVTE